MDLARIPFALFLLVPATLQAHLPRLVTSDTIRVIQPEISQAFYAHLSQAAHRYYLDETDTFDFYLQLLTPDLTGQRTDFLVNVFQNSGNLSGNLIYSIDTKEFQWTKYYEPYGGDHYLMGPEFRMKAPPGIYTISISNSDNLGKYALAIGEKESWPPSEIWNTLVMLPKLKKDFFQKSPLTAYFNRVGVFLAICLLIIISVLFLILKLLRKQYRSLH